MHIHHTAVKQTLEDGMDEVRDRGGGSVTSDDDYGCELLRAIVDNLKDPSLAWIEEQINGIITEVYYCCHSLGLLESACQ
jgi:hypothetical protein